MIPKRYPFRLAGLILLAVLIVPALSCKKNNATTNTPVSPGNYRQTNLVSDTAAFGAARIDTTLVNAWGLAINPHGIMWISENGPGMTAVYDTTGNTLLGPVGMPFEGTPNGSFPSGIVFNPTTAFTMPGTTTAALFIWATENGSVATWAGGDTTATVIDNSAQNSVYKGLTIASSGGVNYLYVADFHNSKVCVFDQNFQPVPSINLTDPGIPSNYGPFNIACFGGQLYVAYAAHQGPDNHDDSAGTGNGYIDVFSPKGTLIKRFASQGPMNSPWGLAQTPAAGFGLPLHSILVGNFGDGRVNVFDSTGTFLGPLLSNGKPISIDGLWALEFGASSIPGADPNKLYFTAGPMRETHGLFGYLQLQQ